MLVNSLMTPTPATCHPGDSLHAAARIMWETDCGVVPVVDEQNGVIGVVTDRDICMAAYTQGRPLSTISVAVAMSKTVVSCHSCDDIGAAEMVMREARVRRLPVVDENSRLVGMLSLNDLAREAVHHRDRNDAPQPVDLTATLATIGEPRHPGHAPSEAS